jgi:hypothetical protein
MDRHWQVAQLRDIYKVSIFKMHLARSFRLSITNYPIDMIVCNQPIIINKINNQPITLTNNPNATTDQRVSRPGGVDAKEGGAIGGTCSSPGGRSSVAVGQQRDSSSVSVPSGDQQTNWNNLLPFETPGKSMGESELDFFWNAGRYKALSAMYPRDTFQVIRKSITSRKILHSCRR